MVSNKSAIIGGYSFLVITLIISISAVLFYESWFKTKSSNPNDNNNINVMSASKKAIQTLCQNTYYQETCIYSLTKATTSLNTKTLIKTNLQITLDHLANVINQLIPPQKDSQDPNTVEAYQTCQKLLEFSIADLETALGFISFYFNNPISYRDYFNTLLTAALTYQDNCLDRFETVKGDTGMQMGKLLKESHELTINSLALFKEFSKLKNKVKTDRKLIDKNKNVFMFPDMNMEFRPNVVVAKDGSGNYKTINKALRDVPYKSGKQFIIYIKEGVYEEYVHVTSKMEIVMFIGDGPTKTKITGNSSVLDSRKLGTYLAATVVIDGRYFVARNIGFENTAGPMMKQAVALRVSGDQSSFYNCRMDSYRNTLYAHTHIQFYHNCTISGTIDFIFGNSQAFFLNSTLLVRKPLETQKRCIVTANGRSIVNQTSSIVLEYCHIMPAPGYPISDPSYKTFLGRPWKPLSTTIVMYSNLSSLIDPKGWSPWNNKHAHLDTCWLAEFNNTGPGADLSGRVKWRGIKTISLEEAMKYYY